MTVTRPPFCQSVSRSRRSSCEPEKTCPTPVNQPLRSPKHPVVLLCSPSRSRCEQSSKKARPSVRSRKVDTLKAAYSALTKLNLLHYSKIRYERQSRSQDGFQLLKSWGHFQKVHFLTHTEFLPAPVSGACGTPVSVPPARRRMPQRCCR